MTTLSNQQLTAAGQTDELIVSASKYGRRDSRKRFVSTRIKMHLTEQIRVNPIQNPQNTHPRYAAAPLPE